MSASHFDSSLAHDRETDVLIFVTVDDYMLGGCNVDLTVDKSFSKRPVISRAMFSCSLAVLVRAVVT